MTSSANGFLELGLGPETAHHESPQAYHRLYTTSPVPLAEPRPERLRSRQITLEISKTPSPLLLFPARNKHLRLRPRQFAMITAPSARTLRTPPPRALYLPSLDSTLPLRDARLDR